MTDYCSVLLNYRNFRPQFHTIMNEIIELYYHIEDSDLNFAWNKRYCMTNFVSPVPMSIMHRIPGIFKDSKVNLCGIPNLQSKNITQYFFASWFSSFFQQNFDSYAVYKDTHHFSLVLNEVTFLSWQNKRVLKLQF